MMITAHSGCDGTPDNTLVFVRHALSLNVDAFEVDVHRRDDGVLVINHDTDETGRYIGCPTLSEVFDLLRQKPAMGINCDLKDERLEEAVIALHAEEAPANALFLSGTVSSIFLKDKPQLLSGVTVLFNAEEIVPNFYEEMQKEQTGPAWCAEQAAQVCHDCNVKVVNVHYKVCDSRFLNTLQGHGVNISVWTPDSIEVAQTFAARNVFNITTRNAEGLLSALR